MKDRPKRPGRTKKQIEEELACCIAFILTIPHEHQKLMTAGQVRSLVEFDHAVHSAIGGSHEFWNLTMRQILDHRWKTHEIDRPQIRKTDRIEEDAAEFRRKMLAKSGQSADPDVEVSTTRTGPKLRSRGFPKPPEGHKHKWGSRKMGRRA